jgi:putative oxidoreductase
MFTTLMKHRASAASLVLRVGLAAIFLWHGYLKLVVLYDPVNKSTWLNPELVSVSLQYTVAWGEMICGLALLIGLLTPLAALGVITIMVGALFTVMRHRDFIEPSITKHGFNYTSIGQEYNFAIITMSLALLVLGSGALSLDHVLSQALFGKSRPRKETGTAERPTASAPAPGFQQQVQ